MEKKTMTKIIVGLLAGLIVGGRARATKADYFEEKDEEFVS